MLASPNSSAGHFILGRLYVSANQYPDAEKELLLAIQLDPKLDQAHLELGNIYRAQGDLDRAIAQYEQLLASNPKLVSVQVLVGNMYLQKNDLGRAQQYYEAALRYDPHDALANANLAWLYVLQEGDLNVALSMAQVAKQQLPSDVGVSNILAWIYYSTGNYRNALPLLRECVQKVPNNATYRYHLGMAELANGDKRTARSELEAALKLKLEGDDAVRAQQTLEEID